MDTFHSGDLSVTPSSGEEHDARDIIRLYKDMMCENVIEFGDPLASVHVATQKKLKITERFVAYDAGDMNNVACGRCIIAMSESIVQVYPRHSLQRTIILLKVLVDLVHNQYKSCYFVSVS